MYCYDSGALTVVLACTSGYYLSGGSCLGCPSNA